MLLKVVADVNGFIPNLKVDGTYWQAPRSLAKGESLEVHDFIGHGLMSYYKGAFSIVQNDPIKDGIDNKITLADVDPAMAEKAEKQAYKDSEGKIKDLPEVIQRKVMGESQIARQTAVLSTAAEYSPKAAAKILAAGNELGLEHEEDMDAVKEQSQKQSKEDDKGLLDKAKDLVKDASAKVGK